MNDFLIHRRALVVWMTSVAAVASAATTSLTLPGETRQHAGFSQPAEENGVSRLDAGIHFRRAENDGRRQGRSIARAVAEALASVR